MFATCKKMVAVLVGIALLAGSSDSNLAWARGGRGGYGGGYNRGYSNYNNGGYNRGYSNYNNGAYRGYNGTHSAGYRGTTGGRYGANSGFAARHFGANANPAAAGAANRMGMMGPYGMGYGGLGYGGMGAGLGSSLGYGMGYPFFGMYGMMGMGMMGMGGMGMGGMGMGGGGGGYGGGGGGYAQTQTPATAAPTTPPAEQIASADAFDAKGEADFKAGNYPAAIQDWQHALVDTPHNGGDMLLLAQSLFASGQYQPAAGAVQLGMQMLPQDQWGNVLKHFTDLYPNNQAFTDQLRALEKARQTNPNDPATRFLLGYEYGYLGYPKQAVAELDKAITLHPQDRGAVIMRNQFATQAGLPVMPVPKLPATPGAPVPAGQTTQRS